MKKIILILTIIILAFLCMACVEEEKCDEPITYRPEIGIGYVFQETDSGLVPVAGAKITVEHRYWKGGMYFGGYNPNKTLATETYTTNAEGCYQMRFVEKICTIYVSGAKDEIYCNSYLFYYDNNPLYGFGYKIDAQNNIFIIDTIKIK